MAEIVRQRKNKQLSITVVQLLSVTVVIKKTKERCLKTAQKQRLEKQLQQLSITAPYVYSIPYTLLLLYGEI